MNQPPLEPDRFWQPPSSSNNRQTQQEQFKSPNSSASPLALFKVLGGSILAALLIIGALVRFYGKDQHTAELERLLLSPQVLQQLAFSDLDSSNRRVSYFADKIVFKPAGQSKVINLAQEDYTELYDIISGDESILVITKALEKRFEDPEMISTLSLMVRKQERTGAAGPSMVFQKVEFLNDGSYYRVSTRQDGDKEWEYFHQGEKLGAFLNRLSYPSP